MAGARGPGAAGATVLAGLAVVVAAFGLAPEDDPSFSARITARDLPPASVYAVAIGALVLFGTCLVTAVLRWRRPVNHGRPVDPRFRRPACSVAQQRPPPSPSSSWPSLPSCGPTADRRLERHTRPHALEHRAERSGALDPVLIGPLQPTTAAWRIGPMARTPSPSDWYPLLVNIPGWDAVIVVDHHDADLGGLILTAIRRSDGAVLWASEPGRGLGAVHGGVAIDPASGRVLLVSHDAFAVLDLSDGSEVRTGTLPNGLSCS